METNPACNSDLTPHGSLRIIPWGRFNGSLVPNWILCRTELSQGAKLTYARLAQYAGKDGKCFPKQKTLAAELGVGERTARSYLGELIRINLIERKRRGLNRANNYFFLDHPWIHEYQLRKLDSHPERQSSSADDRNDPSVQERRDDSLPILKRNQNKIDQMKRLILPTPGSCPDYVEIDGTASIQEAEEIYEIYPKKVGKPYALLAIRKALDSYSFAFILERTRLFAQTCDAPVQYIPHPETWFKKERFNDDPSTWCKGTANGRPQPSIVRPDKFGCGSVKL